MLAHAADDVFRSIGVPYDTAEGFLDFAEIGGSPVQKSHARAGIVSSSGDRVENFVSQRGSQLSHYAQAIHMRELCLQLA